jgi:hypothetical protein
MDGVRSIEWWDDCKGYEPKKFLKEEVATYFEILYQHLPGGSEENLAIIQPG